MAEVKHTPDVELHAVFNGMYWDVSVGPEDYSQCVGSCHANSALGYGLDGAERYARLFAAAPDLFAALQTLATECSQVWSAEEFPALKSAFAALSKATAQQEGR